MRDSIVQYRNTVRLQRIRIVSVRVWIYAHSIFMFGSKLLDVGPRIPEELFASKSQQCNINARDRTITPPIGLRKDFHCTLHVILQFSYAKCFMASRQIFRLDPELCFMETITNFKKHVQCLLVMSSLPLLVHRIIYYLFFSRIRARPAPVVYTSINFKRTCNTRHEFLAIVNHFLETLPLLISLPVSMLTKQIRVANALDSTLSHKALL